MDSHIKAARTRSVQLNVILTETAEASTQLDKHNQYIEDLEAKLQSIHKQLRSLNLRREPDLQDHVKYRDSTFRRFAYKATGRSEAFQTEAEAREKEYFEGLEETTIQQDAKKEVETLLSDVRSTRDDLQNAVQRHREAQLELDELYDGIFAGPTPEHPEEDAAEEISDIALQQYHDARTLIENDQEALKHLHVASRNIQKSLESMRYALNLSASDVWGGRGLLSDMMKRSELDDAQAGYNSATEAYAKAQQTSRRIPDLPDIGVRPGDLEPSFFLRNIFTDVSFREKLKRTDADIRATVGAFAQVREETRERIITDEVEIRIKQTTLQRARAALQERRRGIIENSSR